MNKNNIKSSIKSKTDCLHIILVSSVSVSFYGKALKLDKKKLKGITKINLPVKRNKICREKKISQVNFHKITQVNK